MVKRLREMQVRILFYFLGAKMADVVNNPSHYTNGSIECIEAIESSMTHEEFVGYLKGNCIKYLWRYRLKGKELEDLEKAQWYLNKLIENTK